VPRQLGHTNAAITLPVYAHLFDAERHARAAREDLEADYGELVSATRRGGAAGPRSPRPAAPKPLRGRAAGLRPPRETEFTCATSRTRPSVGASTASSTSTRASTRSRTPSSTATRAVSVSRPWTAKAPRLRRSRWSPRRS
jgi:hypothetical protein